VSAVIEAVNLVPFALAFRNNTGEARVHGHHVRYGLGTGSPDVVVVLGPWGHFVGLEVKLPGIGPRPSQKAWGCQLAEYGGTYFVVHSVAEALAAVRATAESLLTDPPDLKGYAERVSRTIRLHAVRREKP
jgi:hypothetical protein